MQNYLWKTKRLNLTKNRDSLTIEHSRAALSLAATLAGRTLGLLPTGETEVSRKLNVAVIDGPFQKEERRAGDDY
jgi:hypothetical protein